MEFSFIPDENNDNRKIIYHDDESSFDMSESLFSDFSLMIGCIYLGLDICLNSLQIVNISGYCPSHLWINRKLSLPSDIKEGVVKIKTDEDFCSGTGTYLYDDSKIYYDTNNNFCYIECVKNQDADCNIKFCNNGIISLYRNKLVGIWIWGIR